MRPEHKLYFERDMANFDRLPAPVREAIRNSPTNVDIRELKKLGLPVPKMIALIESGQAPNDRII